MSEREGFGEEPAGSRETAGEGKERTRRLRAQAELAWARVQRTIQRGTAPALSRGGFLEAVEQTPTSTYLAGIAGSLVASAWLHARGRRSAGNLMGLWAPIAFALGLYARLLRRSRR